MMGQLLDSDLKMVVLSGFVYLPLLFDEAIEKEIETYFETGNPQMLGRGGESRTIIEAGGDYYIKTMNLHSFLDNFDKIDPRSFEKLRSKWLQENSKDQSVAGISLDKKLITILFQVLPYFIRSRKGLERKELTNEEVLQLIRDYIDVPPRYYRKANKWLAIEPLRQRLNDLEANESTTELPRDGMVTARELRQWFDKALKARESTKEKARLRRKLEQIKQFDKTKTEHLGMLLYIAEKGGLEINGFGFFRIGSHDDYIVYKRTGEYILKDYYARPYLFPACRVAVATFGSQRPVVIEKYKHPLLRSYDSGQEICLRHFSPQKEFTAKNIIKALEEGLNALLYGYNSRRRNGYHSLDRTTMYVRSVDFDDYRISEEKLKAKSPQS